MKHRIFWSISVVIVIIAIVAEFALSYPGEGVEWISIKGGTFLYGISLEEMEHQLQRPDMNEELRRHLPREIPQVSREVKSFQMAKTETTVQQYSACVRAGACRQPPNENRCNYNKKDTETQPVNCVNWNDANAFCSWVGGRLPTEVEWEYAARSEGKTLRYPWGDSPEPSCEYAVIDTPQGRGCGKMHLLPVCSAPKGNSAQGLCDMAGNAWEWTADFIAAHEGFEKIDPQKATRTYDQLFLPECRVIRSGGTASLKDYRATLRGCHHDDFMYGGLSFRCVK